MPFVQRNWKGEVIGVYANPQTYAQEVLPDDHPDVVAFREAHPVDPKLLVPPSPEDIESSHKAYLRVGEDHKLIAAGIVRFNKWFAELETALSALLYVLINKPDSKIAYAIYFSPTSFEARVTLVENSLIQIASENDKLAILIDLWKIAAVNLQRARRLRNAIAHGTPSTVVIGDKPFARLTAPAFDIIRIGRTIANRQIPGLTHNDIENGLNRVLRLNEAVDAFSRVVSEFHEGNPKLQERFAELEQSLTRLRSQ
jgi:hypothetical protein